jgi:exonuclease SbcC
MYALFNGSDRGSLKNIHIVNVRKNYCKASVDISVAGSRYRIERQTTKRENRKGEVHAATHMNMFEIDSAGNIIKDMTDEQRRETEKHVRNLIGTGENFLMTTFASQGAMNNFIKERATNRKSVLTSFLDFDVFEEIHKAARSDMGELKGRLSDVQRRDFSSIEQEKTLELTRAQKNLDALTENLKKNTSDLEVVQDKLSQLPSDTVTQADVDEQEAKIKHAIAGIGDLKDQKEKFINEWRDKKEKVDSLKEFVESSGFEKMDEDSKKATRIKRELEKLQREMQFLEKKVASLSDPEFLKGCKCLREAEESLKKKPALAGKIESLSSTYDLLDVENLNERIRKVTAIRETVHTIERELKSAVSRSGIYDEKIKVLQDRLQLDEEKLSKMKMHTTDAPIDEMVSNLKREKRELERLIREDDGKRISAAKTIGTIQAQIKNLREEKKKFEELNREWKIVEIVAEASSKKGIPLRILNGKLPQVNSEIAQILQGSTGFTIELEADPDSNAMDIYINYGDSRRIIECASGMEKMMASLAIRVALMNLTVLPRCDLLIIDEGFGALDETNVEACSALLHGLTKYFKTILIISHVDAVKDSVDNVLSISKRGQDSYVNTSG